MLAATFCVETGQPLLHSNPNFGAVEGIWGWRRCNRRAPLNSRHFDRSAEGAERRRLSAQMLLYA